MIFPAWSMEVLVARGIVVSHETVRQWTLKFGHGVRQQDPTVIAMGREQVAFRQGGDQDRRCDASAVVCAGWATSSKRRQTTALVGTRCYQPARVTVTGCRQCDLADAAHTSSTRFIELDAAAWTNNTTRTMAWNISPSAIFDLGSATLSVG